MKKITVLILVIIFIFSCKSEEFIDTTDTAVTTPTSLIATAISPTQINLAWNDNSNNETGFEIERKTTTDDFERINSVDAGTTDFEDGNLAVGNTYTYRVRAVGSDENSGYSNEATITTEEDPNAPKTYYIDATNGNDDNNGGSENSALQSLTKINETVFKAGDKILFKSDEVWNGQLLFSGSGEEGNPIIVDSYGTGNKPVFNGGGATTNEGATVLLKNGAYWEINNLEITNTNGSTAQQGKIWGLRVIVDNGSEINHIHIKNCFIHDVNGEVAGKDTGGIYVTADGDDPAFYNDLQISNNIVRDVGGLGIATQSPHASVKNNMTRYPFLNVRITGNIVGPTGRNNMIVRVSDDAIVEHNRLINSSIYDKGHSIFNFNTINCQIQYNEAYGNVGPLGLADRGGFDADYNCKDTKIQYNYSHDNNWGYAIMKKAVNENVTIRYNISENDKIAVYFYGFEFETGMTRANVYNNVHYISADLDVAVFRDRTPYNTNFYNNVFYFAGTDAGEWGKTPVNCSFENNAFYNISTIGTNAITEDPLFVNPGNGGTDIDWSNYPNVLTGYHLQAASPLINAGKEIPDNGGKDFWGNSLYNGNPDIGAYEHQ